MPLRSKLEAKKSHLGSLLFGLLAFISTAVMARRLLSAYQSQLGFDLGEWLINYEAGFVRRGLFGEFILHFLNLKEPFAGYVILFVQIGLYLTLIIFLFNFVRERLFSWSSLALCFSPAVGLFIFENYGITRKELLGLASLIILAIAGRRSEHRYGLATWAAIALFAASCFSSEINALLLPSFLYVLYISNENQQNLTRYRLQKLSLVGISLVSFCLSVWFHGNAKIAEKICADVVSHGFSKEICNGSAAIDWLAVSVREVGPMIQDQFPLYFGYIPLIFLAIFPIVLTPWFRYYYRWTLACVIFIAPLYVIALDYGRWTFMLVTEIVIMIIATKEVKIENKFWNKFTSPLFIFGWGLPFWIYGDSDLKSFFFGNNFIVTIVNLLVDIQLKLIPTLVS